MFIWDFVASTVMDDLIDWFYGQLVGFLGNFFAQMGNMGVELTPYGVQVRYPSHMELDESDMNCALRECRKIREFVLQRLDPHISQDIKAVTEAKRKFEQHMG